MLKRSEERYKNSLCKGLWGIPGGRINTGSSLLENLKREIFEETKIEFTEIPKLLKAQDIILDDKHVVRLTYIFEIDQSEIMVELDDESTEYKWADIDEIRLMGDEIDKYLREIISDM